MSDFNETEFKYLVANNDWRNSINRSIQIRQTYLNRTKVDLNCDLTREKGKLTLSESGSLIGEVELPETMTSMMSELLGPETNLMDGYVVRLRLMIPSEESLEAYMVLSIKEMTSGESRKEFEVKLDGDHKGFKEVIDLHPQATIEKTRYLIEEKSGDWEVDVFHGINDGLVIAELEADERPPLLPLWVGDEVTEEEKYYNFSLLANPYKYW